MSLYNISKEETNNKFTLNNETVYYVENGTEYIGSNSFSNIKADTIVLPDSIKVIQSEAFKDNSYIKKVILSNNIISIGESAFKNCTNLESINLPDTITTIYENCFSGCKNLKEIKLPKHLKIIPFNCFKNCNSLNTIKFSKELEVIENFAFSGCSNLNDIIIPNSVKEIGSYVFYGCEKLNKIVLSEKLKKLNDYLFCGCTNLKNIVLPNSIQAIESYVFSNCKNLNKVVFPNVLKKIGSFAFLNCNLLEEIFIENNEKIKIEDSSLSFCSNLKKIYIKIINSKNSDSFIIDLDFSGFNNIHFDINEKNLERLSFLSKKINKFIQIPYNFGKILIRYNQDKNFGNGTFKFYKRLEKLFLKDATNVDELSFLTICYNLGVFHEDKEIANKSTVFIEEILTNKVVSFKTLIESFERMDVTGYKKDYSNFIMNKTNFKKLFDLYNQGYDIFSESYNNFEKIQEFNLSKNVQHRQLAPTVERCKEFLIENKFENVTEKTKAIAEEVGKFSNKQRDFELGVSILQQYEKMKEENNYIDLDIESNPFETINALEKEIFKTNVDSVKNITNIIDNDYTFEWLKKNDPKNLMLGYYCSCCAHIDGTGEGIMIASIVHPSTRNLVVKDENGKIVAKFTLYVNTKKGYGIFNTASINGTYITTDEDRRKILKLLLQGTNSYCIAYNEKYPKNKIKQVNIGEGHNGLSYLFNEFHIQKTEILKNLNYKKFSDNYEYEGDSNEGQYCIFKLEENDEKLQ